MVCLRFCAELSLPQTHTEIMRPATAVIKLKPLNSRPMFQNERRATAVKTNNSSQPKCSKTRTAVVMICKRKTKSGIPFIEMTSPKTMATKIISIFMSYPPLLDIFSISSVAALTFDRHSQEMPGSVYHHGCNIRFMLVKLNREILKFAQELLKFDIIGSLAESRVTILNTKGVPLPTTKNSSIWFAIFLLAAILLRFSTLGRNSLWFDEAWGVFRAYQPLADTLAGQIEVGRPPLYYAGLHYWVKWVGSSETAVRFPSALASLFSVGLVYLLGRQLGGRRVALVAMSLLAFSPLHVWYAQEVRMYIFVACLGLVVANGLVWGRWLAILPVTAALTVGLYIDFPMIPLAIGLSAAFLVYWWGQGRPKVPVAVWFISTAVAILLYQPWWSRFAHLLTLLNDIHFFEATRHYLNLPEFSAGFYALLMMAAGVGLLLFFALVYQLLQKEKVRHLLTPFAVVLFIICTLAFVWPRFFGLKRVIATGWPYVCLLIAWLVVLWPGKRKEQVWYGLMGISLLATLVMLWAVPKDDWRSAVAYIEAQAQPEDIVWIDPPWNAVAYEYYQAETAPVYGELTALKQMAVTDIWLVAERFPMYEIPSSASESWLDENFQLVEAVPFYRLQVRHYQLRE